MIVLFAFAVTVILLVAALAFDVGLMLVERRDQQNAADAAALAGARYVKTSGNYSGACPGGGNQAAQAACSVADANGFVNGGSEIVNVYIPPIHGRYVGLPGFVEAEIQSTRPSFFGIIAGFASWPVSTFAVAADAENLVFEFSMLALNNTECKAIQVSGGGVIYSLSSIQSNSNGSEPETCGGIGMSRTGTSTLTIDADDAFCRSAGDIQNQGSGSMTCEPDPDSFILPDPLQYLLPPPSDFPVDPMVEVGGDSSNIPRHCPGATTNPPSTTSPQQCVIGLGAAQAGRDWILSPGLYPGGLDVRGGTTVYLLPGIYWIGGGGFRTAGDASVISIASASDAPTNSPGGGVLIYNSSLPNSGAGAVSLGGSGATLAIWPLNAPSEGDPLHPYNRIAIFQARGVTSTVTLNGSASGAEVVGIVYVPDGEVKLNGNGGTLTVDQIIADTFLIDGGGGTINVLRREGQDAVISGAGLVD